MTYLFIILGVLVVIGFSVSFGMYLRDKRKYSRTATEYLEDRRIQAACRMLREQPDRSIEEIGTSVGIASIPAFRKLFFRTMGQTPKQYRQMTDKTN